MGRNKTQSVPHNVKERLRHQNLQKILENVASYVPKHPSYKKETKARKLRRVVLYIKFLLQKTKELNENQPNGRSPKKQQNGKVAIPKMKLLPKTKRAKAHIVFLKKSSDAPVKKRNETLPPITSLIDSYNPNNEGKKMVVMEDTMGTNFESRLAPNQSDGLVDPGKAVSSGFTQLFFSNTCDNYLDKPSGYAFVPNVVMETYPANFMLQDENMHSVINSKEFSAQSFEDQTNEIQASDMAVKEVFEKHQNEFTYKKNTTDPIRNGSFALEQNVQTLTTNLERNQRAYVPERSSLIPGQFKKSIICNSINDVNLYSPKGISQYKSSTSHEVPASDETSLYINSGRLQPPGDSVLFDNTMPGFSELAMVGNRSPNHTLFSQNSDNWSSDFVSSGESGPLTSSNEYMLSDEEGSNLCKSADLRSSLLLVPDSVIDDDSYDYTFASPERNCDISPTFCGKDSFTNAVGSSSTKLETVSSSGLAFDDYEKFVDIAKLEQDGSTVFVCNDLHAGIGDSRYIDRNFYPCNVHNLTPNVVQYALPRNASEGYGQIPTTQNLMVYSSCMPNEESYFMDSYHPREIYNSHNSVCNKHGNIGYSGIQIKQEYPDSLSPPENQGNPFDNLSDSNEGYMGNRVKFQ